MTEVAKPFHMSLNAVSKHIRVLEASGVVERHRKGRDHILSINTRSLDEIDGWIVRMRRYWEGRLDAMERLLRERPGVDVRIVTDPTLRRSRPDGLPDSDAGL